MNAFQAAPTLVGRTAERARLDGLLADAAAGRSRALVLRGEAGIGKTTLLDHLAAQADRFRVLRVAGVESETEIPFAGLQVLFAPVADRIDGLPPAPARAMRAAVGATAEPGDALLVRAATLTLLSELAEEQPLLCLVDDAHLVDRESAAALLFAVRRLHDDPVGVVLAARDGDRPFPADGIDSVTVPRLDRADAVDLLDTVGTLAPHLVDRILQDSRGNPLAVLELAAEPLHGSAGEPDPVAPLPAAGRLERHFRARLDGLPDRTRTAMLVLAADPGLRLPEFAAAAAHLGIGVADLEPAELQGLVTIVADEPVFRHPLVRAAAYQGRPLARRLAAHEALTATLRGPNDADRRAWHRAASVIGVDDSAAAGLDAAAERGRDRGAPAAASRAWERAADLSGSDDARGRRLVEAARSAYDAGELDRADSLAAGGADLTADPGERADALWVRAQVAYERESPARASTLAIEAVAPIARTDPVRAAGLLTEASWCARDAADPDLLRRCRELLDIDLQPGVTGFVDLLAGDLATAVPAARELIGAARAGRVDDTVQRFLGSFLAVLLGDDADAVAIVEEHVAELRRTGALGWLPYALELLALAHLANGGFTDAAIAVAEGIGLARELDQQLQVIPLSAIAAVLSAVGGSEQWPQQVTEVVRDHRGHRMAAAFAHWAHAIADLAAGRPAEALPRLETALTGTARYDVTRRAIADHVEAAVRVGDPARAQLHLPALRDWAAATGSPAAQALDLRCAALLDGSKQAAELFEEALAGAGPYDRARTLLSYGEWLRRHRRPGAARDRLVEAHEVFLRIGARGWTPRVEAELRALGASAPAPATAPPTGPLALTPQELQVARLAAQGLTNREIAAHLFLSPRTVGHHLYKAYPKLGIARRAELAQLRL